MAKIVQCVPNFSEGRRQEVIDQILGAITSVEGVKLVDYSSDASHNRSVVTFLGEPQPAKQAAFKAIEKAKELINMDEHKGEHPRMGATDVVPFIPIREITMEECVELARELGQEVWEKLQIPVYLYEKAACAPERQNLSTLRKGQYEGLKTAVAEPERMPDFGEAKLHPTAGITAIGARPPLIAYNINLGTNNVEIAKKIANVIRGSKGGFPAVKALGIKIEERDMAQVTINMCNFKEVSLFRVFEIVKNEAERYGVNVIGSEIVGLTPMEALIDVADHYLRLENFKMDQILETKL
ncbi:glutamate formimidoyltransferase [Desulfitibacter alkalitolerans]|uniref:glutamate formimidoyltransferase n=1 Tax=Desulfitibacter alkalitolerans TaxID=264641 RepID=UPI0004846BEE|nr:glutamate formimidoyltransferase [Desulfitibacter alkalitolerans]